MLKMVGHVDKLTVGRPQAGHVTRPKEWSGHGRRWKMRVVLEEPVVDFLDPLAQPAPYSTPLTRPTYPLTSITPYLGFSKNINHTKNLAIKSK